MGIRLTTSISEIDTAFLEAAERMEDRMIHALAALSDECVAEARNRTEETSWFDHSGNLRSSIGYVIVANGRIVQYSDFNQVKQGFEGIKKGRELAEELARKYSSGYALIVVAGMNYAELVEAMDNKVVLASAELYARQELPKMMVKLKS